MSENEISIYCHEKFLRHNPSLCEQMDGGYRRSKGRNKIVSPIEVESFGSIGSTRIIQGSALDGTPLHPHHQQEQQNKMMKAMNQLHQTEQQRLAMLQQLMQQEQVTLLRQSNCQEENQYEALFMGQTGRGGGEASAVRNNMIGLTDSLISLPGRNHGNIMNNDRFAVGMHCTNQGFMPYRSNQNLLGMDLILDTLFPASNVKSNNPFKEKHDANRE